MIVLRKINILLTLVIWVIAEGMYLITRSVITKDLKKKEGAYGFCHITDDDMDNPREFHIEIDTSMKHSIQEILTCIAHEMTHLKQFVKGELYDREDGSVQWKSKRYIRKLKYDDMPWEKEAYRLENKLFKELRNEY